MEKSSFFNSINRDRAYSATDISSYFSSLLTNGVLPASTNLQVIANNNMSVTVKAGKAFIKGCFYDNDSDLILPIATVDGMLSRMDRIVVQYSTLDRKISIKVKQGVASSSPVVLALQRDFDAYELGIADIYIGKGVFNIVQAYVTDLRLNTTYCGLINSLIQADTTAIFNQYQNWFTTTKNNYNTIMVASQTDFTTQFNTWFTTVKTVLNADVAGNLQTEIDGINTTINSNLSDTLYQLATGTSTALIVPMLTLKNGYAKNFIASADNNGSATTINGKRCYKPATTIPPTFKKDKFYTVVYNSTGDCFFNKASATGSATKAQVLANVPYSNENDNDLLGEMINRSGTTSLADYIYTDGLGTINLRPKNGFYDGNASTNIQIYEPNFIAPNLLAGKSYLGMQGEIPYLAGTIIPTGVAKWGDGSLAIYSPRGYNKGGAGDGEMKVPFSLLQSVEPNLISSNIPFNMSMFGLVGTTYLTASDNVMRYDDNMYDNYGNDMRKITPTYTMLASGSVRIQYTHTVQDQGEYTGYSQVYKNGSPIGRYVTGARNVVIIQDFPCVIGDYFQIYSCMDAQPMYPKSSGVAWIYIKGSWPVINERLTLVRGSV